MHDTPNTTAPPEATHSQLDEHKKAIQLHREALRYVISLVQECQERGGYTLPEAVQLQEAVSLIRRVCESTDDTNSGAIGDHVDCVARLLLKSQAQGKLTLQEAWTTYNALSVVCPARVV